MKCISNNLGILQKTNNMKSYTEETGTNQIYKKIYSPIKRIFPIMSIR